MKNIAIILAGGKGLRTGMQTPKQFIKIAGKMVIEHAIDTFEGHNSVDEIAIVCQPSDKIEMERICSKNQYKKVKKILYGGKERYQSSLSAINAYSDEHDVNLIFHDAVRPLVSNRIISDCIAALEKYDAVDVAIKTTDTIIEVNDKKEISHIPDRNLLFNGQTPQAFKLSVIKKAYDIAMQDPDFKTSDDCGVVIKYMPEIPVCVVNGEEFNIKLTYIEDIYLIDKLFQLRSSQEDLISVQKNSELKDKVIVIFGGSYGIGLSIKTILEEYGAIVYSFSRTNGVDVSKKETIRKALSDVYQEKKNINFVINCAGILKMSPINVMSEEDVQKSIKINYLGAVYVAQESFQYLRESCGGLVFFSSSSYTRGRSLYSLYSSSKAAIVNLTQALCEEWGEFNIKVNCINPERTATPMRVSNFGNEPMETLLTAREVAISTINAMLSGRSGEVFHVKKNEINQEEK